MYCCMKNGDLWDAGRVFRYCFPKYSQWGSFLQERFPEKMRLWMATGVAAQAVFGLFSGMFIGCLALAIAEMLDSIPILREGFRSGMVWDGRS